MKLAHLSDLHFTMQDRTEEYLSVWGNMCHRLRALGCPPVVITGDIFHEKTQLSSRVVDLARRCMYELCELSPAVYVIAGNHDFLQQNPDICDSVTAIFGHAFHPRFHYLKESGLYEFGELGFGVLSVFDALAVGAPSGRRASVSMPSPGAFSSAVRHRVALFHGSVVDSTFFGGWTPPAGTADFFRVDLFRGYDVALLGDNHCPQFHPGTLAAPAWGYAGSLLQQNFGESLEHGFLLWDLETRTAHLEVVENAWAFATSRMLHPGELELHLGGRWQRVTDVEAFPSRSVRLRCYVPIPDHSTYSEVAQCFQSSPLGTTCRLERLVLLRNPHRETEAEAGTEATGAEDRLLPSTRLEPATAPSLLTPLPVWVQQTVGAQCPSLAPLLQTWLQDPAQMVPWELFREDGEEQTRSVAYKRDTLLLLERAQRALGIAPEEGGVAEIGTWRVCRLAWDNLLSYGPGNELIFDEQGILLLRGANGTGKSAVLDILCLALFRSPIRERGRSLLHLLRKGASSFTVTCEIEHTGRVYRIHRQGRKTTRAGKETLTVSDSLFEVTGDGALRSLLQGESDADGGETTNRTELGMERFLRELLGTKEEFLASSLLAQGDQEPFLRRNAAEQKAYLQKWLRLDKLEDVSAFVNKCEKGWTNLRAKVSARLKDAREALDRLRGTYPWLALDAQHHPEEETGRMERAREREALQTEMMRWAAEGLGRVPGPLERWEQEDAKWQAHQLCRPSDVAPLSLTEEEMRLRSIEDEWTRLGGTEDADDNAEEEPETPTVSWEEVRAGKRAEKKTLERLEDALNRKLANRPAEPEAEAMYKAWQRRCADALARWGTDWTSTKAKTLREKRLRVQWVETRIATLRATMEEISWNPDCWACQKTSAAARRKEDTRELESLEKERTKLLDQKLPLLEEIDAYLQWDAEAAREVPRWETWEARRKAFSEWTEEVESLRAQMKTARKNKRAWQEWVDLWEAYHAAEGRRARRELTEERVRLREQVADIQRRREAWSLWDLENERLTKTKNEAAAAWRRQQWNHAHARCLELEAQSLAAERRATEHRVAIEEWSQTMERKERLEKSYLETEQRLEGLGWLDRLLVGDKGESYASSVLQKVVPWVMGRVHDLLGDTSDLRLTQDAASGEWNLHVPSTGLTVPTCMASGYQMFLLGLCVRVVLLELAGRRCQQLFLDEGFTACDGDNLARMPDFLQRIRSLFHSILLITHLPILTHAADRLLPIAVDPLTGASLVVRSNPCPQPAAEPGEMKNQDTHSGSAAFSKYKVAELRELLLQRGITPPSKAKKNELLDILLERRDRG